MAVRASLASMAWLHTQLNVQLPCVHHSSFSSECEMGASGLAAVCALWLMWSTMPQDSTFSLFFPFESCHPVCICYVGHCLCSAAIVLCWFVVFGAQG